MHKVKELPPAEYLARPAGLNAFESAEDPALIEEALARDKALRRGGAAIEWDAFESWVRSRLAERMGALPAALLPGA